MHNINIYFIRHGLATGNLTPHIVGQSGHTTLTELGERQVAALGHRFADDEIVFDKIISSTYTRAKQTAKAIHQFAAKNKIDIDYDERLKEYNPGDWLGKDRNELMSDISTYKKYQSLSTGFKFPNGESLDQVSRRVMSCLEDRIIHNDEVIETAKHKKQHIAVVFHGLSIKSALSAILRWDSVFMWRVRIDNAGITHLVYKPNEGWFIRGLNDISHLKGLK